MRGSRSRTAPIAQVGRARPGLLLLLARGTRLARLKSVYVLEVWASGILLHRVYVPCDGAFRPVSLGTTGDLRVTGADVLPVHAWVGAHADELLAMSVYAARPAYVFAQPLASTWTRLPLPCLLRLGAAVVMVRRLERSASGDDATGTRASLGAATTIAVTAVT